MFYKFLIIFAISFFSAWLHAEESIQSKSIHFAKGSYLATVQGTIKGKTIIDYKLLAKAGQTMSIKFKTSNASSYFNILPPKSNNVAIFIGSINGNEWSGLLENDGSYTIRVYLMRNAARRNEIANYSLTVEIPPKPSTSKSIGKSSSDDAKVKGTRYHATGEVPCSMGNDFKGQCKVGVIRGTPGNAEVYLTPPGGIERVLTFIGSEITADADGHVQATKSNDLWSVEVNQYERYQIPDVVILGD